MCSHFDDQMEVKLQSLRLGIMVSADLSTSPWSSIPSPVHDTGIPVELQTPSGRDEQTAAMRPKKFGEFAPPMQPGIWT
jgi:hypothetical protein